MALCHRFLAIGDSKLSPELRPSRHRDTISYGRLRHRDSHGPSVPDSKMVNRKAYLRYTVAQSSIMLLFTALALSVIRISYTTMIGPDPDPYGFTSTTRSTCLEWQCILPARAA